MKKKTTEFILPKDLKIVGLDTDDGEDHPLYQDRAFLEVPKERIESFGLYGCQEVIQAVRWDGVAYVISGRQRVKAGRISNRGAKAPRYLQVNFHRIAKGDNLTLLSMAIRENSLRESQTPLESGAQAAKLKALGEKVPEIAKIFGVTSQTVKNWLEVDKFEPEVKAAIGDGRISHYNALMVFRKKGPSEQSEILETLGEGEALGEQSRTLETLEEEASGVKKKLLPDRPRNMAKRYAKRMVMDEESPIDPAVLLGMKFMTGLASGAECSREIEGFSSALAEAKKFFKAK